MLGKASSNTYWKLKTETDYANYTAKVRKILVAVTEEGKRVHYKWPPI